MMRIARHILVWAVACAALFGIGALGATAQAADAGAWVSDPSRSAIPAPSARAIEVDGILGHATLTGIKIVDGRLDAATLANALDPPSAAEAPRLLQAVSARGIRVDSITLEGRGGSPRWRLVDVRIDGAERGQFATLGIGQIALTGAGVPSATFGRVEAQALDLQLLARFLTLKRESANEPLSRLCGGFAFEVRAAMPEGVLAATVSGGGISVRPLLTFSGRTPKLPPAERERSGWRLLADGVDSVAVDRIDVADLVFRPAKSTSVMKLARARVAGVARGVLGEFSVDRLGFTDKGLGVTLDRFGLTNVRFRESLQILQTLGFKDINPQALKPFIEAMELRGLDVSSAGTGDRFGLERLLVGGSKWDDAGPPHRALTIDHVQWRWPASSHDELAVRLSSLGYRSLDLSGRMDWVFDTDKEALRAEVVALGAGMGRFELRADLDHFSLDVFDSHKAVAVAAILKTRLRRLALRYTDDSFAARMLALDPVLNRMTVQQRRDLALKGVQGALRPLTLADLPPTFQSLIAAIQTFAGDPRSLAVSLSAPKGIGMAEAPLLKSPRDLLGRIEVDAAANR